MKVLIVDDEDNLRQLLAIVVGEDGHEVTEARSGKEAFQLIQKYSFDRIITDYNLGGPTGEDVAKFAKEKDAHIRVLLISGIYLDPRYADAFITKPFAIAPILEFLKLQYV